ncbi:nucleotide pyrophosphohydrolase [Listeria booriae]|uniref:nucleotide pyrophosphohydrolase n=1 Tax=Listeria booriae TaxID=1552123 RepID=UPI001627E835|nr:nucleotide pyrophosphohydrolase [Listeria booriae]MBC1333819.1 nucleotide pyrophosphohydrolase [Listeria booriae]
MDTIETEVHQFLVERGWENQYQVPKDLAISLTLEATELLECFQWKSDKEAVAQNRAAMSEELADVFIYATQLATALDLDIETIVQEKLAKNATKYPPKSVK